jgi:hypothetical protein
MSWLITVVIVQGEVEQTIGDFKQFSDAEDYAKIIARVGLTQSRAGNRYAYWPPHKIEHIIIEQERVKTEV